MGRWHPCSPSSSPRDPPACDMEPDSPHAEPLQGDPSTHHRSGPARARRAPPRRGARRLWILPIKATSLAGAGVVVILVRVALWVLPPRAVLRFAMARVARARRPESMTHTVRRIAWAVRTASRPIPGATCLTQALATQILLAASDYPSTLRIGVARDHLRRPTAHAWVEVCGKVLVGGRGVHLYRSLPDVRAGL